MKPDLTSILHDWPFRPGKVNARLITGDDGRRHVQVRLDVGILQMQVRGRPDGTRPEGFESLLEYHETRLDESLEAEEELVLGSQESQRLREEAAQYHHRYLAMLALEDFESVVRDTARNLRVIELCAKHAENDSDKRALLPLRPYIAVLRARALASLALRDNEPKAAILAIDGAMDAIRVHYESIGAPERYETAPEMRTLRGMRDALVPQLPVSQSAELRTRLEEAIASENYELASILRDELRSLGE